MSNCQLCGEKLEGRSDKKFCNDNHRVAYYRMVNKPHYLLLNRKHQQAYRERNKKTRWCKYCGAELFGRKRSYCDKKCEIKYKLRLDNSRSGWETPQKYVPMTCDECGGRIKVMNDGENICSVCGLVM